MLCGLILFAFLALLIVVSWYGIFKDLQFMHQINVFYKDNIYNKDPLATSYLSLLSEKPTWRASTLLGLIITLFILLFMFAISKIGSYNFSEELYLLLAVFVFILTFTVVQKYLSHYAWHYLFDSHLHAQSILG